MASREGLGPDAVLMVNDDGFAELYVITRQTASDRRDVRWRRAEHRAAAPFAAPPWTTSLVAG